MIENDCKQYFLKILSQKYISVLLAVFVFVTGMLVSSVVTAAPAVKNVNPAAGVGQIVDSLAETVKRVAESYRRVKTFNDDITITESLRSSHFPAKWSKAK